MDRAVAALSVCAEKLRRRNVSLVALGRDRGLPPRRQRPPIRRAGARTRPASSSTSSRPQEEARLAVLGCHKLLEPGDGPALIFDIGGGSTELVLIDQDDGEPRIRSWWSAPWGVVSLTESEGRDALEGPDRLAGLRPDARARPPRLRQLRSTASERREGIRLLGTSGTVTTLASVHLALPAYDRRAVDGLHVPVDAMQKISTMIAEMDHEERAALAVHRPRARRPGRRRLRDPRGDHRDLAGRERSASPTAASARASSAR